MMKNPWLEKPVPRGWWNKTENQRAYFLWLGKKLGFKKPEDWYQVRIRDFPSAFQNRYRCSPVMIVQTFIPEYDFKPWLFAQTPRGFWDDINNQKDYFIMLANKKGFNKPEDWYNAGKDDFNNALLQRYKNEFKNIIQTFIPEYDFKPWLFKHVPKRWWETYANQKQYVDWLGKKLGYNKPEDWYKVRYEDFEPWFLKKYGHSPQIAVQKFFPHYDFKPWLFNRVPPYWWKDFSNQKKYISWLGKKLGYEKPEDWYKVKKLHFAPGFLKLFNNSPSQVPPQFFPNYEFKPWLFEMTHRNYFKDKKNQTEYIKWLGNKLRFEQPEDWYKVKMSDFESAFLTRFGHSPYKIVKTFFPDFKFKPWLFKSTTQGFWNKKLNQKDYIMWLGKRLGFKKPEDWYKVKIKHFAENYGGGLLAGKYRDSYYLLIQNAFPEYQFKPWLFDRVPVNFWNRIKNRKDYILWLGKKLGAEKSQDWYGITAKNFHLNNGGALIAIYYENSPQLAIKHLLPEYNWEMDKFVDTLKSQRQVFQIVKNYFKQQKVIWEYKSPKLRFKKSGRKMRFDIFIPSLKFAIEYQGIQHFKPVKLFGGEKRLREQRKFDAEKREACIKHGITLLEVPYTWSGKKLELIEMINKAFGNKLYMD